MKLTKKKVITIVSVVLAVALAAGATIAYLVDKSETIKNEFNKNKVTVELAETTDGYDIIPGTEEAKDPKVSGNATLPAYVFVEVNDNTDGLVDYTIADGWTKVEGKDNIYYREVPKGDYGPFSVLKGDKVSYSEDITNEDMDNATDDNFLEFTAYAIQKAPFASARDAWDAIEAENTQDDIELPDASLSDLNVAEIGNVTDEGADWTGPLDTAVVFGTDDTAADIADKDYKDWIVDFKLSFNKDVDGSKIHLFGNYGSYGWRGDDLAAGGKATLAANEELAVMADWFMPAIGLGDGQITYSDCVNIIQNFKCGIACTDDALAEGLVANLDLVIKDGEGAEHVIDSYQFAW